MYENFLPLPFIIIIIIIVIVVIIIIIIIIQFLETLDSLFFLYIHIYFFSISPISSQFFHSFYVLYMSLLLFFACLNICVVIFIGHPPGRYGLHVFPIPPKILRPNNSPPQNLKLLSISSPRPRLPSCEIHEIGSGLRPALFRRAKKNQ